MCYLEYEDRKWPGLIGPLGDVGHLRSHFPNIMEYQEYDRDTDDYVTKEDSTRHEMEKNTLYWITDRTPHEALGNHTG